MLSGLGDPMAWRKNSVRLIGPQVEQAQQRQRRAHRGEQAAVDDFCEEAQGDAGVQRVRPPDGG